MIYRIPELPQIVRLDQIQLGTEYLILKTRNNSNKYIIHYTLIIVDIDWDLKRKEEYEEYLRIRMKSKLFDA